MRGVEPPAAEKRPAFLADTEPFPLGFLVNRSLVLLWPPAPPRTDIGLCRSASTLSAVIAVTNVFLPPGEVAAVAFQCF